MAGQRLSDTFSSFRALPGVDVDSDRETGGFLGDEYTLSAMRFVPPSSSGDGLGTTATAVCLSKWMSEGT